MKQIIEFQASVRTEMGTDRAEQRVQFEYCGDVEAYMDAFMAFTVSIGVPRGPVLNKMKAYLERNGRFKSLRENLNKD